MAGGATLPSNHVDQSTAHMFLTDQSGQNVNGQNGVAGLFLDPFTAAFQPIFGDPSSSTTNSDPAGLLCPPGSGLMNVQQYEVTLDPNYIADRQWERNELQREKEDMQWENEEMQRKIDHLEAKWIGGQQVSHGSAQTD